MTANARKAYGVDVADVEYLRHGMLPCWRGFLSRGGPFPLIIQITAARGTWGSPHGCVAINEPLAKSGVVVAALISYAAVALVPRLASRYQLRDSLVQDANHLWAVVLTGRGLGQFERSPSSYASGDAPI
jgi:hypothetical protein